MVISKEDKILIKSL